MSTVVQETQAERASADEPPVLHILDEETDMSVCGLTRPKPGVVFDTLTDSNRHLVCVVCLELSGA